MFIQRFTNHPNLTKCQVLLASILFLTSLFFPLPVQGQSGKDGSHRAVPNLDVIMIVDESETMWNKTDTESVRVNTVNFFIDMLSSERSGSAHRLGIVAFGTEPYVIPLTLLDSPAAAEALKAQYAAVHQSIGVHKDSEYTDVNLALNAALVMIEQHSGPGRKSAIILISDGQPTNRQVSEKKGRDTVVAYLDETQNLLEPLADYAYLNTSCPNTQGAPLYMVGMGVDKLAESSTPEFIALYREFWRGISAGSGGYYKEASKLQEMQSISTYIFAELLCTPATPPLVVHSPQVLEYQVHNSYFQIFFNISGKENAEVEAKIYRPKEDGTAGGVMLNRDEESVSWQSNNIDYELWAVTYTEPWAGTWQVVLEGEGRAEFSYVFFPNMTIHLYEPDGGFLPADKPLTIRAGILDENGELVDVPVKDFQVEIEGQNSFREQLRLEKQGDTFLAQLEALGQTGEYSLILQALLPDGTPLYEHKWITLISAPWVEMIEPTWGASYQLAEPIPLQARVHVAGATSFENVKLIATLLQADKPVQTIEMSRGQVLSLTLTVTGTLASENVVAYSGSLRPVDEIGSYTVRAEMIAVLPGGRVFNHETVPLPLSVLAPPTPTPSPSPLPTSTSTPSPTPNHTPSPVPIATPTPTPTPVSLLSTLADSPYCLPAILALLALALLLTLLGLQRRKRRHLVPAKIELLAELMRTRRESSEPPYLLILGSGPSVTLGSNSMKRVVKAVAGSHDLQRFYEILDGLSLLERFTILKKHFAEAGISSGYRRLAELVRKGFFDVIFTTNLDPFLEDALTDSKMEGTDFEVLVCGEQNGKFTDVLESVQPRVKIVKLHGDLLSRSFAFTPSEISLFGSESERVLRRYLYRDLIIVGHGPRDYDINRTIEREGGSIWYVNQNPPSTEDMIYQAMRGRGTQSNVISGEFGLFDRFFETLHAELMRY